MVASRLLGQYFMGLVLFGFLVVLSQGRLQCRKEMCEERERAGVRCEDNHEEEALHPR